MKTVAIIQARMGSTRLPGKVLRPLEGEPMLARVVTRTRRANRIDAVVVATTTETADDLVAWLCVAHGWPYSRGSEADVLDRYYQAAREHGADVIVRLTGDCPLIDPELMDQVVGAFHERRPGIDYASNILPPRTFPRGLDAEVFTFAALARAWKEDNDPARREHVTPYIWRQPEKFRLHRIGCEVNRGQQRWTVDTPEDWQLVERIYRHFGHDGFSWREVVALLEDRPEWLKLNRHVQQKAA